MSNSKLDVSIVICTRNRCKDLRETLTSLASTQLPPRIATELIVVDNGSTDATESVVKSVRIQGIVVRYLHERRPGLSVARNVGIAASCGRVILFTDDDVRVPSDWVGVMCRPILDDLADAVSGGIRVPERLKRSWMWRSWLDWIELTSDPPAGITPPLIGANFAFGRHVLQKVPAFDSELGAGQLGSAEDSIFGMQLLIAGYRIVSKATESVVNHHFDESRLNRDELIRRFRSQGRSAAYVLHHWEHSKPSAVTLRLLYRWLHLCLIRFRQLFQTPPREGLSQAESAIIERVAFYAGILRERRRPRNYERHGLVKKSCSNLY